MDSPKSPFLPNPEELKELDRKDGFDRTPPPKPPAETVTVKPSKFDDADDEGL